MSLLLALQGAAAQAQPARINANAAALWHAWSQPFSTPRVARVLPATTRTAVSTVALPFAGAATATNAIAGASSKALPLTGSVTAAVRVTAASTKALPFGAVSDLDNPIELEEGTPERLPLAGSIEADVRITAAQASALPIGGSATLGQPPVEQSGSSVPHRRLRPLLMPDLALHPRFPLLAESEGSLGLGGRARLRLGARPIEIDVEEALTDEIIADLLAALV